MKNLSHFDTDVGASNNIITSIARHNDSAGKAVTTGSQMVNL